MLQIGRECGQNQCKPVLPDIKIGASPFQLALPSYVEEAPRLVLPLEATSNSSASAFAELDIALQAAVAAQPRPGCIAPADQACPYKPCQQ